MESRLQDLRSQRNPKARIKVMEGHFATTHSHVNTYIDMSTVKSRHNNARETARLLADHYMSTTSVDTIVCTEGTQVIGAFLAELLADNSMMSFNTGKNISVITPEYDPVGQLFFRDNTQRMLENMQVLLLVSSTTTGRSTAQAMECIKYYGGMVQGIAAIFSATQEVNGVEVFSVFNQEDLPNYQTYSYHDCPYCKQNQKVEAIINSYGYSKL